MKQPFFPSPRVASGADAPDHTTCAAYQLGTHALHPAQARILALSMRPADPFNQAFFLAWMHPKAPAPRSCSLPAA